MENHEDPAVGAQWTHFIDQHPELAKVPRDARRAVDRAHGGRHAVHEKLHDMARTIAEMKRNTKLLWGDGNLGDEFIGRYRPHWDSLHSAIHALSESFEGLHKFHFGEPAGNRCHICWEGWDHEQPFFWRPEQ